jgi:hypothetical protein
VSPRISLNKCLLGERIPDKIRFEMVSHSARKLSGDSTVVVSQDQVSCELGGEAAILNLKAGVYYGLSKAGGF